MRITRRFTTFFLSTCLSLYSLFLNLVSVQIHKNSKGKKMAIHLQPSTITLNTARSPPSLAPTANAGLRLQFNPLALKSSFFSGPLNLLLHPKQQRLTSGAPRISMRVTSKQAYICRDCGFPFIFSLTLYPSHISAIGDSCMKYIQNFMPLLIMMQVCLQ